MKIGYYCESPADQSAMEIIAEGILGEAPEPISIDLTWNYADMANRIVQSRLEELCAELNLVAPLLVSPESIPQVHLGQSIRRKH